MAPVYSPEWEQLQAPQSVYLWQIPYVSSWVEKGLPAALPGLVYAKIGSAALQRLNDFRLWPAGWNNGTGDEIAWGTLQNLESFLDHAHFRTARPPSLFLTDAGHLELVWEARNGSEINVEITPSGANYFFQATGEEGGVSAAQLADIATRTAELTI